jgi:biotin operon repressor
MKLRGGIPPPTEQMLEAALLQESGKSLREVGEAFGISRQAASAWIERVRAARRNATR